MTSPWEFYNTDCGSLPHRLQRGLKCLMSYVYLDRGAKLDTSTTVSIGYTRSQPGVVYLNMIEIHDSWKMVSMLRRTLSTGSHCANPATRSCKTIVRLSAWLFSDPRPCLQPHTYLMPSYQQLRVRSICVVSMVHAVLCDFCPVYPDDESYQPCCACSKPQRQRRVMAVCRLFQ